MWAQGHFCLQNHISCGSLCFVDGSGERSSLFLPKLLCDTSAEQICRVAGLSLGSQCEAPLPQKVYSMSEDYLVLSFSLKVFGLERHAFYVLTSNPKHVSCIDSSI